MKLFFIIREIVSLADGINYKKTNVMPCESVVGAWITKPNKCFHDYAAPSSAAAAAAASLPLTFGGTIV